MKSWLYDVSMWGYWQSIRIVSPFVKKANLFLEGRKNWKELVLEKFGQNTKPIAWFHCASLGEFEQARPLLEAFRVEFPHYKILLTFFSPSGFEVRKNYQSADWVMYLPLDTANNAAFFVQHIKPSIAFFIKYEFWLHFIEELHRNKIPILSVSSIFRPEQHFFKGNKSKLFKEMLNKFDHFFVQNEESRRLLSRIGIHQHSLAGDTRFDRVMQIVNQRIELPILEHFIGQGLAVVVGSAWQEDIEVLAPIWNPLRQNVEAKLQRSVKLIIAPHEVNTTTLRKVEKSFDHTSILRYSKATTQNVAQHDILLIDNIGMLSSIYSYADVAYVGGAFGKGLHNILEAATFGMPILFGNQNYQKFQEAVDLIAKRGAFAVANSTELQNLLYPLLVDEYYREQINEITRQYVISHTGATQKILDYCHQLHGST